MLRCATSGCRSEQQLASGRPAGKNNGERAGKVLALSELRDGYQGRSRFWCDPDCTGIDSVVDLGATRGAGSAGRYLDFEVSLSRPCLRSRT